MADAQQSLQKLIESIGDSSQFATSGALPPVLPGLEVKGIGPIGSPVSAADAKRLIARATQAPYGLGEQTIVDTKVRRVWQFEPNEFQLKNREWDAHVAEIVEAVRAEFGIEQKVKAELYKLLVYQPGSFFAPHRDTEKTRRMFATLVVCLPSLHQGGVLVVRHDGQEKRFDFGGKVVQFKTQYAAFYADCEHEIKPVASGHRICLVYNLATVGKRQPSAPRTTDAVAKAADLLQLLFTAEPDGLTKLVVPFVHQYTKAGLAPAQLKGADRARADVLVRAAESLGYTSYIALLTHSQSGSPDYDTMYYDPYPRRKQQRWSDNDDDFDDDFDGEFADDFAGEFPEDADEEEGTNDEPEIKMDELCEESLSLDHWLDPLGRKQSFGAIHVLDSEVLGGKDRSGWARRQEVLEATGNEGASLELWYRKGVLVIWPAKSTFQILAAEGQRVALPELEKVIAKSKSAAALAERQAFAQAIIDHWKSWQRPLDGGQPFPQRMLAVLERIGTPELVQSFLQNGFAEDLDGSVGTSLLRLCNRLGWPTLGGALCRVIERQQPSGSFVQLDSIVAFCRALCCNLPPLTEDRRAVCIKLANALAGAIERWDRREATPYYLDEDVRTGVVEGTIRIFADLAEDKRLDWFVAHVLRVKEHYDLHQTLIPEVKAIYKWLGKAPAARRAAMRLLEHCRSELRAATASPVEPPTDWTRESNLGCKCADCQALSMFLRDPRMQVARFPLRKERRRHLHGQIEANHCDCTHVTDRRGSPQTLVCMKTQESYKRRLAQYERDQKRLAELDALASGDKVKRRQPAKKGPVARPRRKTIKGKTRS